MSRNIAYADLSKNVDITPKSRVVEWNNLNLNIKNILTLNEVIEFMEAVTMTCFVEGDYRPEFKDFAMRCVVAELYVDIELPDDVDDKYSLMFNTDLYEVITSNCDKEFFKNLKSSVESRLDYLKEVNIDSFRKDLVDNLEELSDIEAKIRNAFQDVNENDIGKFLSVVSKGEINEKNIAKALVDAYTKQTEKGDD